MILTQNLVEFLLSTPEVQALVADGTIGSDPTKYPRGYIFEGKPYARIDNLSHSSTLVIYSNNTWSPALRGNSLKYPLVHIEIWAASTKGAEGDVLEYDADDVIEKVYTAIEPYIHLVHRSPTNGAHFEWNSARIVSSEVLAGPIIRNVTNAAGAKVATIDVGVQK